MARENDMNIGEVSAATGVSAKMIRYYEKIGLIHAVNRSDSGYRQYTVQDQRMLAFIRRARELGFSLERIKTLIGLWEDTSRHSADVRQLARQYIDELDEDIANLRSIRNELAYLADHCHGDNRPDCPIIERLAKGG
jgi:MerR family copper efflux transcriptional regulator